MWVIYKFLRFDIALIYTTDKLYDRWTFLAPICLPQQGTQFNGTIAIAGFGRHIPGQPTDLCLRMAFIRILPDSYCQEM